MSSRENRMHRAVSGREGFSGVFDCESARRLQGEGLAVGGMAAAAALNFAAAVVACLCSFPLPLHFPSEQPNKIPAGKMSYLCSLQTSNPLQQSRESTECQQTGSGTGYMPSVVFAVGSCA